MQDSSYDVQQIIVWENSGELKMVIAKYSLLDASGQIWGILCFPFPFSSPPRLLFSKYRLWDKCNSKSHHHLLHIRYHLNSIICIRDSADKHHHSGALNSRHWSGNARNEKHSICVGQSLLTHALKQPSCARLWSGGRQAANGTNRSSYSFTTFVPDPLYRYKHCILSNPVNNLNVIDFPWMWHLNQ